MSYNNIRTFVNDNYSNIRPAISSALIEAVTVAEERNENIQMAIYFLAFQLAARTPDLQALRNFLSDDRTQDSSTRSIFSRFVPPSIVIPDAAVDLPNPMPEGIEEARAPGIPSV
jgi:hypothetical protein